MSKESEQTPSAPKQPKNYRYELYTLVHDLVYILAAITFVFVFAFRLVGVNGDSMYQTLHNNDYLILCNSALCRDYEYGDVVVAAVPDFEDGAPIVKRVIATGGQTVDIVYDDDGAGAVYVDGVMLSEPYINEAMSANKSYDGNQHISVPEGMVFLMGDNRNHSTDSRFIGCVDERYLLGKVLWIALPGDNSDGKHNGGVRDWSRIGTVNANG